MLLLVGNAVAETRYMRSDQHTVNGVTAYKLGTAQTAVAQYYYSETSGSRSVSWGIQVFKVTAGGSQSEITGGTPVAVVTRTTSGSGMQSATWNCPETQLSSTDAILVQVYMRFGTASWMLCAEFITEQLGASKLDSATWTVYYHTTRGVYVDEMGQPWTYGYFRWGTSTYNSRIEGFAYTIAGVTYNITVSESIVINDFIKKEFNKKLMEPIFIFSQHKKLVNKIVPETLVVNTSFSMMLLHVFMESISEVIGISEEIVIVIMPYIREFDLFMILFLLSIIAFIILIGYDLV